MSDCIVQNTFVNSTAGKVGGVAGENNGQMINCHNLGFTNKPSNKVAVGSYAVGGQFFSGEISNLKNFNSNSS